MKTTPKLIIANWKMNPDTETETKIIISEIKKGLRGKNKAKIVVCPPFVFMSLVKDLLKNDKKIVLGTQDIFVGLGNSHTGEISVEMIKDLGAKYVIIGHSERRAQGDTEEIITKKISNAFKNSIKVILCIGERERNEHGDYYHEIKNQLLAVLSGNQKKYAKNLIVAYEPIWAIGKSEAEAMNPEKLHEMTIFIRKTLSDLFGHEEALKVPVLYGGSVGTNNAKTLIEKGNIDGLLIGRESLKPNDFVEIVKQIK